MTLIFFYKLAFIVTAFGAGLIVIDIAFKKVKRGAFYLMFALMSVAFVVWASGRYMLIVADSADNALLWAHFLYNGSLLVHLFFLHTIILLLGEDHRLLNRCVLVFFYLLNLFLIVVNNLYIFTGQHFFVSGVVQHVGLNFLEVPDVFHYLHLINYLFIPLFTLALILKHLINKNDKHDRKQLGWVLFAAVFGFLGGNSIVPVIFGLNIEPVFLIMVPFYIPVLAYAIAKHHLFDIKVAATEIFVFSLWIFILVRIFVSDNSQEQIINSILLLLTVIVGAFLIRSVLREIEQREKIEVLAKDLGETNERQEKLIHFIGHEVKGYLTKGEYAFSEMTDGDYGELPPEVKILAGTALNETRKGVQAVTDILQAANLKRGTVTYDIQPADFRELVKEWFIKTKPVAEEKGLKFEAVIDEEGQYAVKMDKTHFGEHVIRNLIDNSIKYTPSGTVIVGLSKRDGKILFSVKDTGVGIAPDDMKRLFTEGGRGKDSVKVNVHSTGYGLYIAKQVVEAHGGRIWAESEGAGKGSAFFVELPAV